MIKQDIIIASDGKSFTADFPNIFENYILPHIPLQAIVKKNGIQIGFHFGKTKLIS